VSVRRWWPVCLPLLVAGALAPVLPASRVEMFVAGSARSLAIGLGVAVSVLLAAGIAALDQAHRRRLRDHAALAARAHEERLRLLLRLDHELKNPLTAIHAGLANLAASGVANEPALDSVRAQTRRLSRLVADLRKLAELETRPIERYAVDLGEVLREVHATVGELPEARARDLRLTVPQAPWPLPPVPGDRDLLFLAVHNLAANAVKFSDPGDTVELRAYEDREDVVVEVADTGIGIPLDEQDEVWAELARGRAARGVPGTGLGLALVRAVVTRHGGQTSLRSREQQGTVVTLRLPLPRTEIGRTEIG
jgi:two-component system OmpR family sensor kinase